MSRYKDISEFDPLSTGADATTELVFQEDHFSSNDDVPAVAQLSGQQQQQGGSATSQRDDALSSMSDDQPALELPSSAELDWFIEAGDNQREAKRHLLRDFLKERQREFTDYADLTVFCGTWNVNNQFDESVSLANWLQCDKPPDLYALGFQELDLSTMSYITQRSDREEKWTRLCQRSFPSAQRYTIVKAVRLFSTFLLVAAKDAVARQIRFLRSGTQATGLMGIGANKGGTAARFQLGDTEFTFVNCHLAAGEDKLDSRYGDLRDIQQKLRLVFDGTAGRYELLSHTGESAGSHVTFCMGDLNFRLAGVSKEEVEARLVDGRPGAVEDLLAGHDELRRARAQTRYGDVFLAYSEAHIDFWPSYKYQLGSRQRFDTEKLRVPSWCDRVLYRSDSVRCEPLFYRSQCHYVLSDHKPVSCAFRTQVARVDPVRQRRTLKRGVQWLDSLENAVLPQCTLEPGHEVQFGLLNFFDTYRASLTLRNVGRVAANWELAPTHATNVSSDAGSGVRASPAESRIPAGGSELLLLDACLGPGQWPAALRRWAAGQADSAFAPQDVLVIALLGGAHMFVVPRGELAPSCYGLPLSCLCRLREPVSSTDADRLRELVRAGFRVVDSELSTGAEPPPHLGPVLRPIPAEVTRLLESADPDAPDLLPAAGDEDATAPTPSQLAAIADALSRGDRLPSSASSPSASLHALLLLLRMLPETRLLLSSATAPASPLVRDLLSRVFAWARRVCAGPNRRRREALIVRLAGALDRPSGPVPSEFAVATVRAALDRQASPVPPSRDSGRQPPPGDLILL